MGRNNTSTFPRSSHIVKKTLSRFPSVCHLPIYIMHVLKDKSNNVPPSGRRNSSKASSVGKENASSTSRTGSSKSPFVNESVLTIDSTPDPGNLNLTRISVSDGGVLSIHGVGAINASLPTNVPALVQF